MIDVGIIKATGLILWLIMCYDYMVVRHSEALFGLLREIRRYGLVWAIAALIVLFLFSPFFMIDDYFYAQRKKRGIRE